MKKILFVFTIVCVLLYGYALAEKSNDFLNMSEITEMPEEGVYHGIREGTLLPRGVYDTDYPIVQEYIIDGGDGKIFSAGDTVTFKFKFFDNDGIGSASVYIGTSSNKTSYINLINNKSTGYYEGSYTFKDTDVSGSYHIVRAYIYDTYGYYTSYSSSSKRVMQRFFPGIIYLNSESVSPVVPIFTENGKTLKPGNTLHIAFNLEPGKTISYYYLSLYKKGSGNSIYISESNYFSYNPTSGQLTVEYPLTADLINGQYYIGYLNVSGYGNSYYSFNTSFDYMTYYFTLTEASAMPESTIKLSDISFPQDGQTLTDGDTITTTFKVTSTSNVNVSARMEEHEPYNHSYGSGVNKYKSNFLALSVSKNGNIYTATYTLQPDDVYGVYMLNLSINDGLGNYKSYSTSYMIKFAENRQEKLNRLGSATNVYWTSKGVAKYTMPSLFQNEVRIIYYNENDEIISSVTARTANRTKNTEYSNDSLIRSDIESGKYYFTVTFLGDGETYYDSKSVKSPLFTYTAPSSQLGKLTKLYWEEKDGNYTAKAKCLTNTNVDYQIIWYYSETKTSDIVDCEYTTRIREEDVDNGYVYAAIPSSVLNVYGSGYYYYKVRATSQNITQYRNGDWSAYSPAQFISGSGNDITAIGDTLSSIAISGASASEIRSSVQSISKNDLVDLLSNDENSVYDLRKLEVATGTPTSVKVEVDLDNVKVIGTGLNTPSSTSNVTFVLGKKKYSHVVPGLYSNMPAVLFSSKINNITEWKVPVVVDIEIPDGIYNPLLLKYNGSSNAYTEVKLNTYRAGENYYSQFVLYEACDYVLTDIRALDGSVPQADINIPSNIKRLESESLAGIDAEVISLPGNIQSIANDAFSEETILIVPSGSSTETQLKKTKYWYVTK